VRPMHWQQRPHGLPELITNPHTDTPPDTSRTDVMSTRNDCRPTPAPSRPGIETAS
jgi:hypothetical protein